MNILDEIEIKYNLNNEHIFIVNAWIDNNEKEKLLIECIKKLKEFNIPILLVTTGNRPYNLGDCIDIKPEIKNMVNYFLYNEKNEILPFEKIKELNINSLRYIQTDNVIVHSYVDFHHDYAVLSNLKEAIIFCNNLGKTKIHYLEYDNIIDSYQFYQTFANEINNYDCVLYEYDKGSISNNYSAFFIFSMKIELALKFITEIKSLYEHFSNNDWRAENFLLNRVKKYTDKIKITNYIDSENGLNKNNLWNLWDRDALKGFSFLIVVDNMENLYIMFNSENKCLIEIKYQNYNKFDYIQGYKLLKIGKYNVGNIIKLKHMGKIFYTKILKDTFANYLEKNYIWIKINE